MIEARHRPIFDAAFGAYCAWSLRRHFHAVWVRGNVPDTDQGLIVAGQHVAWWDPVLMLVLKRRWWPPGMHYAMMDERNLRRFGFFRWVGTYGVDLATREGRAASVAYTRARLAEPRARVILFAQGRQRPMDVRPIACEPGVAFLAAETRAPVVPMVLRYEYCEEQRADLFVQFGEPVAVEPWHASRDANADPDDVIGALLEREADRLRDDVFHARLDGFTRLLRGSGARDPRGPATVEIARRRALSSRSDR